MQNETYCCCANISEKQERKFAHLWHLVGNTPMLELHYTYKNQPSKIYVKCEHYNLTGSVKDRMALYIMHKAYCEKQIEPGDTIVEATSGNTGIAFSAIGKALGHNVKIIMPNWLSKERMDIISSLGADIVLVSKKEGGFLGSIGSQLSVIGGRLCGEGQIWKAESGKERMTLVRQVGVCQLALNWNPFEMQMALE